MSNFDNFTTNYTAREEFCRVKQRNSRDVAFSVVYVNGKIAKIIITTFCARTPDNRTPRAAADYGDAPLKAAPDGQKYLIKIEIFT